MRYIILAVLLYCLYLFLRFLIKVTLKNEHHKPSIFRKSRKIDLDKIEDAEYEEINNNK